MTHCPSDLRLPMGPLEQIVRMRGLNPSSWGEADHRSWLRAKKQGFIVERTADRICLKHLDLQSELVWPELTQ